MTASAIGGIIGLVVGIALSIYVARVDLQKRQEHERVKAEYRASLFVVPLLLALLGAAIGGLLANVF